MEPDEEIQQGIHIFLINLYVFSTQLENELLKDEIEIISRYTDRTLKKQVRDNNDNNDVDAAILSIEQTIHQLKQTAPPIPPKGGAFLSPFGGVGGGA